MNHGQWTKGKPIPGKYRNKMYAWEGGGYDGCIWEMNFGLVTNEGHWDPIYSSGCNGLDQDEWYNNNIRRLKMKFGFQVDKYGTGEDVDAWYASRKYHAHETAMKKFYGEKYFDNPEYYNPNAQDGTHFPDVHKDEVEKCAAELLREDAQRYREYCAARREIEERRHELLDEMFMDQVKAQAERGPNVHSWDYHGPARDRWEEYPLDDDVVKATCERFCREYESTVGVMCGVLDALAERGYDVWCSCSDCGEQFQLSDYEKFSHLIDKDCYHGDGGIGCIFTRVQCEECHRETECPQCFDPNLPTRKDIEDGHAYDHWTFRERFVGIWIGVCDCCAYAFFSKDEYRHWDEDMDELEAVVDDGTAQLEKYIAAMKESGRTEEDLKELREKNLNNLRLQWCELFNALRDRMQHDVERHFCDCADWAKNRIAGPGELKDYV